MKRTAFYLALLLALYGVAGAIDLAVERDLADQSVAQYVAAHWTIASAADEVPACR